VQFSGHARGIPRERTSETLAEDLLVCARQEHRLGEDLKRIEAALRHEAKQIDAVEGDPFLTIAARRATNWRDLYDVVCPSNIVQIAPSKNVAPLMAACALAQALAYAQRPRPRIAPGRLR
jgi:hypothetical protein